MAAWWDEVTRTVAHEFSDLPDLASLTRVALRLVIAAALGGVLGYEREHRGKPAGMRTHMLVALGAALFVLVPQQAHISDADLSRILQGVVAGVGFLGAGTIIKRDNGEHVEGLTTAAGLWLTAAIGVAAGLGRELTAIFSTLIAMAILTAVPQLPRSPAKPPCPPPSNT